MADYPSSIPQHKSSREGWVDPTLEDRARSGSYKGRQLQAAKKKLFTVVHRQLTPTQKDTLETFYDTNRALAVTFAWNDAPGVTYTVRFSGDGFDWERDGYYWTGIARLAEE